MKVILGNLARSGIEARLGGDVAEVVRGALRRYAEDLTAGREQLTYPGFRLSPSELSPVEDVELSLDIELEEVLEAEVRRQDVSMEQLVSHAVFLCLAEIDRTS